MYLIIYNGLYVRAQRPTHLPFSKLVELRHKVFQTLVEEFRHFLLYKISHREVRYYRARRSYNFSTCSEVVDLIPTLLLTLSEHIRLMIATNKDRYKLFAWILRLCRDG